MYFLAALLTLKAMEPDQSPLHLADHDESIPSRQELRFKDALLGEDQMTAAILFSAAGHMLIRLACWSKARDTPASLLQAPTSRPRIEFAQQCYAIESVDLTDPLWTGISTWTDLLNARHGVRMRFTFATPLVTAQREQGTESNILPFPDPQTLFSRLLHHWRELGGPPLPYAGEQMVQAAGCILSEYRLETAESSAQAQAHPGFLGWVEYTCRAGEITAVASLNALARLAFFTGSGYLTALGMGTTAVTIAN
jgi:CRISPR-associated endoribonuclease Cas6